MRKPSLFLLALLAIALTSCSDDTPLPPYTPVIFLEDFQDVQDDTVLDTEGWANPSGGWQEEKYAGNGYASFDNIGTVPATAWLVSPPVTLNGTETLAFHSAQHHLPQTGSSLEVFVSTSYTGDVATADWQPLEAVTANATNQWYSFVPSGDISLTGYSGTVHFAFRATVSEQGAAYFLDNVKVF